jgi:hypothetical protein
MKRSNAVGERDLAKILQGLAPRLGSNDYTFCTVPSRRVQDLERLVMVQPLLMFREQEGVTLIVRTSEAERLGLGGSSGWRRITLLAHSHLEAAGLTAAISGALAEQGIPANMVAGYFHDHVFVPAPRADEAVEVLLGLARDASASVS